MTNVFRNRVYLFDWIILGYCLVSVVAIAGLGRPLGDYVDELLFYSVVAVGVIAIIRFAGHSQTSALRFVRLLYPLLLFGPFYRMTGGLMFLLHDHFLDAQVVALERAVFGVEPTLFIDKYLLNVWLNEIFMFCYATYYLMLPGFLLWLFFRKKDAVLLQALAAICLTFFTGYLLFWLYPVEGPRWHLVDEYLHMINGPVFRPLVEFVQHAGSVRGGCVPSTHIGVAIVINAYMFRLAPGVGRLLVILNIGMAIGTVWGRYHYISDVIIGTAIAAASLWLVNRVQSAPERSYRPQSASQKVRTSNVS